MASHFPVHDWQFLAATAIAIGAAVYLCRKLLPGRGGRRRSGRRATLTIEGRSPAGRAGGQRAGDR